MDNLILDFQEFLSVEEISPSTIRLYADVVRRMSEHISAAYPGADFSRDTVQGYMIQKWAVSVRNMKPTTRALYYAAVKRFLVFLFEGGRISANLSKSIPKLPSLDKIYEIHPETRPDKRAYTEAEIQAMMNCPSRSRELTHRNRLLIVTLVSTGLRISEALQLTVGDVLQGSGSAMVARKRTHGNRVHVSIPTAIIPYARAYVDFRAQKGEDVSEDSPLFVGVTGEPLTRRDALGGISAIQKKLGLPTGLHTFRHTAITAASKIADPGTARDIAGQKSFAVTNRYVHSTLEDQLRVTEQIAQGFFA